MSVRGIGEGHRSSIGFRTGVVDAAGRATIDEPARSPPPDVSGALLDAAVFRGELGRIGNAGEAADYVFDALGDRFTRSDLDERLDDLRANLSTRGHGERDDRPDPRHRRAVLRRRIPQRTSSLSERVLWPAMEAEQAGMEDARFVRFVDDDGSVTYYATYTAYSGSHISQQLLETTDFQSFTSVAARRAGRGQQGPGVVPAPDQRSLRRACRDRTARPTPWPSPTHLAVWTDASPCQQPTESWETLQLGNCGPPIETDAGWLVLTHGVGPMRTYSIGAILLDLDDPTRVLGRLRRAAAEPRPRRTERLRAQRRLLLRRAHPRRHPGDPLRHRRQRHRHRHRAASRAADHDRSATS